MQQDTRDFFFLTALGTQFKHTIWTLRRLSVCFELLFFPLAQLLVSKTVASTGITNSQFHQRHRQVINSWGVNSKSNNTILFLFLNCYFHAY